MRWPWQSKSEKRDSSYTDTLIAYLVNQATGSLADAGSTAAVEAAAGALSRAFASAEVQAESWAVDALAPAVLGQIGRDLIRQGGSLHVIALVGGASPRVRLLPAASWSFTGADDPDTWRVEATTSGPSGTVTRNLPYHGVIFCAWGHEPGRGYTGIGPTAWAFHNGPAGR